jgi:transcriptional regulator with XRE-family HTH domain/tetratricopeptide (TPR) repeat protein
MTDDLLSQTIRDARRRRSWTQRYVAEQLQALAHYKHRDKSAAVNADMVSKWERGEKGISPYYCDLLCLLFDTDAVGLGLRLPVPAPRVPPTDVVSPPIEEDLAGAVAETTAVLHQLGPAAALLEPRMAGVWKDELMRRRTLVKLIGLAPMAPAIAKIPGQSPSAPRAAARDLDDLADRYQVLYHSASPSALIGPVIAHLDAVSDALRASRSGAERVKLLMNRARVSLLAGRLSFFDFDDAMSARGYYNLAVEAASEAGDRHQSAAALGHMAFIPAAELGMSAALDYLDGAKAQIDRDPHGPLASWVYAIESEFHSHVGNHGAALRAVDSAQEAFTSSNLHADLRWFDYYDQNRLAGFAGYANLQAGRFDEAAERLTAALDLPLSAVKQRSVFLTDLATVHVHAGDIDLACQVASDATDELHRAGYATGLGRLREFRDLVSVHHSAPAVRNFSERLSTLELQEA